MLPFKIFALVICLTIHFCSNTNASKLHFSNLLRQHNSKHSLYNHEGEEKFHKKFPNGVLSNCTEHWFTQYLDHFNYREAINGQTTYDERYYICGGANWEPNEPIWFYTGNEADVQLYINATGLMWENADDFNAIMVFAEHRYFGQSIPFSNEKDLLPDYLYYLSTDQALADYATLINFLKNDWNSWDSPVIAFGGSYGGMLCSWFRIKYPTWVDGCIAGSAPIVAFEGLHPPVDDDFFAKIETYDCTAEGGSNDYCSQNFNISWDIIYTMSLTSSGREQLQNAFNLCNTPKTIEEGYEIADWVSNAIGSMTMGSYPYPSSYMLMGQGLLPAYPMITGCNNYLNYNYYDNEDQMQLLENIGKAVGIYYNYSGTLECYDLSSSGNNETDIDGLLWNYLYCSELLMPFGTNGITDMFWYAPWNLSAAIQSCKEAYGYDARPYFAAINFGGWQIGQGGVSNIVFSNGEYDPWRGAGITVNLSESLPSIIIPKVGHHIDLFFSNEDDTDGIKNAREFELSQIKKWTEEAKQKKKL